MRLASLFAYGLLLIVGLIIAPFNAVAASQHHAAFVRFVESGNYQQANFYLRQGYVSRDELDTSQIYFRIIVESLKSNIRRRPDAFQYLNALKPIDLNRKFLCREQKHDKYEKPCYLTNLLAHGQKLDTLRFFVERGLGLNAVNSDAIPATFHIVNRLGKHYSLADTNQLTAMGMIFGDEVYDPALLADLDFSRIVLPLDTGSVTAFNFMDVLAISLANVNEDNRLYRRNIWFREGELSRRDDLMCSFISHSAQKFAPSFDYLTYLLDQRPTFRAANLKARPSKRQNVYFRAFPHSCVQLISALARSFPNLETLVSRFAAEGDVATAQWLLSFQQKR